MFSMSTKILFFLSLVFLAIPFLVTAEEKVNILFFESSTCPHCADESKFLDDLEKKYPSLEVSRHFIHVTESQELLKELVKEYGIEKYLGIVPLTFVGNESFVGFDDPKGVGKQIEDSYLRQLENVKPNPTPEQNLVQLPFVGSINPAKYSLPVLAIILGFLDGFNVCSLGALVMILGLVLVLKSRKKIILFGSTFIVTTAVIYGLLIVLWFKLFSFFSSYLTLMTALIGLIGIGGSIYFFKEFYRFKKYGPTCEISTNNSIISRSTEKVRLIFQNPKSLWALVLSIFIFAGIVTIIEFPCSAAIPVVFAGILSDAGLSGFSYILYISLFIFFYMLDELIVFLIATYKMHLWLTSPKFTIWITFIEAVVLGILGLYYLLGVL